MAGTTSRWVFLRAGVSILALAAGARADEPATSSGLEEVVVTAQLRRQSLQDVPISVDAVSSDFIQQTGAQDMGDIQQYVPGLSIDTTSKTQPTYSIRGVSGSTFGIGTEPSVGLYIDGVYSARSGEALVFFNDVERVEVLKGPQGTLFGRNTSAGAISVVTNKPTDQYEGMIDLKLGNYNKAEATAMINIPITDTLSFRADAIVNTRDGFIPNLSTGNRLDNEHNQSYHVALRWRPGADTDVNLTYDHDDTHQTPPTAIGIGPYANWSGSPYVGAYDDEIGGQETRQLDAATLTIQHDFGPVRLTSISAYRTFHTTNLESETGTNDPAHYLDTENIETNHNLYQELRLSGTAGPFTYAGGASYFQEHAEQSSVVTLTTDAVDTVLSAVEGVMPFAQLESYGIPAGGLPWHEAVNNVGRNRAVSLFGDTTYALDDQLNLTAGLRYTRDYKSFSWAAPPVSLPQGAGIALPDPITGALGLPSGISLQDFAQRAIGNIIFNTAPFPQGATLDKSASWTNLSPRFVVDYHWTKAVMTYASASFGYKAGGFNSVALNSEFQPEKVKNYEIGVKSDWLDRHLQVNGSAYYYTYTNQQSLTEVTVPGSLIPQYITSTGDSYAKGADLELAVVPIDNLRLGVTGGYIDSLWNKRAQGEQTIAGGTQYIDLHGQPTGEPALRTVLTVDYRHGLGDYGQTRFHLDHSYTSAERQNDATRFEDGQMSQLVDLSTVPGYHQSHNLTNARLTWVDPRDTWEVALYGQNLFDHRYVTDPGGLAVFLLQSPVARPQEPPRFFGGEVTMRF